MTLYFFQEPTIQSWFFDHPVRFYLGIIIVSAFILIPVGLQNSINYREDVLVEAHGLLFDLLVFGILLAVYEKVKEDYKERKLKTERYKQEIAEFQDWKSDEAKFKIRANVLRLNKLGFTEIDLSEVDLSNLDLKNVKFNNSSLFKCDFSSSNMANSEFKNVSCSSSVFKGNKTFLLNANFQDTHFQYCDFSGTYLNGANFSRASLSSIDFRGADMRNINFEKAYFYDPNLDGAEVNSNFLQELKKWKITGHPIYDWYEIITKAVPGSPGHFQYFLKEKPNIDKSLKIAPAEKK